ncbi:MAG: DNA replication protein [Proteobacteria bacterium]|nr:DNA replication protein [Pseudomonadota bacterium]
MKPSKINCLKCDDSGVRLSILSRRRYAQAGLCDCVKTPCPTCKGSGFLLENDELQREIAITCPECEERERRIQLYNSARVPKRFVNSRLQESHRDENNENVFELLKLILRNLPDFLHGLDLQRPGDELFKGIVLMGPPGTGKTHLMTGFTFQCSVILGISCVFQGFSELLSELRQGYSDGKSDVEIIEPHLRTELLIIDDLGKGRNTDWELGILDTLISERYNRNQLIMATTNFTEKEETTLSERVLAGDKSDKDQYINDTIRKRVGERIYSRLQEMCYFENLSGPDRRTEEV